MMAESTMNPPNRDMQGTCGLEGIKVALTEPSEVGLNFDT